MGLMKTGYCHGCRSWHGFEITGVVRGAGIALGVAGALAAKHPLPALLSVAAMAFGDAIEERIAARCPACAVALDLVQIVVRA